MSAQKPNKESMPSDPAKKHDAEMQWEKKAGEWLDKEEKKHEHPPHAYTGPNVTKTGQHIDPHAIESIDKLEESLEKVGHPVDGI